MYGIPLIDGFRPLTHRRRPAWRHLAGRLTGKVIEKPYKW
jgi:hypothetical protein